MDSAVIYHKELASSGRWAEFSFAEQMANVGSEVYRACSWKQRGREDRAQRAAERALELLDLTIAARIQSHGRAGELPRLREVLCDCFFGDNDYGSDGDSLNHYFDPFTQWAVRIRMAKR